MLAMWHAISWAHTKIQARGGGESGGRIALVATGALTNVALLLMQFPEVADMIDIIIMGGESTDVMDVMLKGAELEAEAVVAHRSVMLPSLLTARRRAVRGIARPAAPSPAPFARPAGALGLGNTGPVVEFNIQTDPEAARIVFQRGRVAMVPLEVTHTALLSPDVLSRLATPLAQVRRARNGPRACQAGSLAVEVVAQPVSGRHARPCTLEQDGEQARAFRDAIRSLVTFFAQTYLDVFGFEQPPLHDPCAVALACNPAIFRGRHMRVDIDTASPLSR